MVNIPVVFRMEIWLANMAHIEKHNFEYAIGEKTFTLGMNHYGDLSSKEFASTYNGFLHAAHKTRGFKGGNPYLDHVNADELEVPKEMDWREHGLVTDVKDQGIFWIGPFFRLLVVRFFGRLFEIGL